MTNNKRTVIEALQALIADSKHDESRIEAFFATEYQQWVDGQQLDYRSFVEHMETVKRHTRQMRLSIKSAVAENDTVFTHHAVNVEKNQHETCEFEVFARFRLAAGKIIRCEELTRMVSGAAGDSDLGSRR